MPRGIRVPYQTVERWERESMARFYQAGLKHQAHRRETAHLIRGIRSLLRVEIPYIRHLFRAHYRSFKAGTQSSPFTHPLWRDYIAAL